MFSLKQVRPGLAADGARDGCVWKAVNRGVKGEARPCLQPTANDRSVCLRLLLSPAVASLSPVAQTNTPSTSIPPPVGHTDKASVYVSRTTSSMRVSAAAFSALWALSALQPAQFCPLICRTWSPKRRPASAAGEFACTS